MCKPEPVIFTSSDSSASGGAGLALLEVAFTAAFALARGIAKVVKYVAIGLLIAAVWAGPKLYRLCARVVAYFAEKRRQQATVPPPAPAPATVRRPVAALTEQPAAAGVTLRELFRKQPANATR